MKHDQLKCHMDADKYTAEVSEMRKKMMNWE